MSFQLTVLKVLAGRAGGRATLADVRQAVAILMTSGKDWSERMKRLAEHAPGLNIFAAQFVVRDPDGWEITPAGRAFLTEIETAVAVRTEPPHQPVVDELGPEAIEAVAEIAPFEPLPAPERPRERGRRRRRGLKGWLGRRRA
ncbi:hypothetical protein UP10_38635 [Bradyrhizobium sp. LTSPM299]|uniref:hypothetical protein n=1 Tax=Bradyrhizobium sp. LTSPM299 TaxID=1619233 RepID=UPI0005CB6B4A|nr:hypothetical protein [Bradyrhizobium sp. LTSPM299]KJC55717.1 hypothetical protein UP10_38635 [Bradyrhizobium sp. LTSPM299]